MKKVKELDALATEMVGDGGKPNVFFVTRGGKVATITRSFQLAHREWRALANCNEETMLEDRRTGVIASASVEPSYNAATEDFTGPDRWTVHDDSIMFKFRNKDGSYK